jgi:ABC-type branched-subunit amino acid transport system ATPase component
MHMQTNIIRNHIGGVAALEDVSLEFPAGQVTAVIGPNGAGKTTLFNVMAGYVRPDSGSVRLAKSGNDTPEDIELTGRKPHEIARRGIGVLFQDIRVFGHLSAIENVAVGFRNQPGENPLSALFGGSRTGSERAALEHARAHLEFVGLVDKAHVWAANLSYGQQKLVALARLLASEAGIFLLDEPTAGIHPDMIKKLLDLIERLADERGKAVIMVEHNLNVVREIGDWVYLMAGGRVEVFGKPAEVLRDESLKSMFPTL